MKTSFIVGGLLVCLAISWYQIRATVGVLQGKVELVIDDGDAEKVQARLNEIHNTLPPGPEWSEEDKKLWDTAQDIQKLYWEWESIDRRAHALIIECEKESVIWPASISALRSLLKEEKALLRQMEEQLPSRQGGAFLGSLPRKPFVTASLKGEAVFLPLSGSVVMSSCRLTPCKNAYRKYYRQGESHLGARPRNISWRV